VQSRDRCGGEESGRGDAGQDLPIEAGGGDVVVDADEESGQAVVGGAGGGEEVVGERQVLPVDACEPAGETDSEPLKRREVDVAMIIASEADNPVSYVLAFVAMVFGAMNVVGGYVVTDRMLQMFRKKPTAAKAGTEGASDAPGA
jgi:hypothetical protein